MAKNILPSKVAKKVLTPQMTFPNPTVSDFIRREHIEPGKQVKTRLSHALLHIETPCIVLRENGKRKQTNQFAAVLKNSEGAVEKVFYPRLNDVLYIV